MNYEIYHGFRSKKISKKNFIDLDIVLFDGRISVYAKSSIFKSFILNTFAL